MITGIFTDTFAPDINGVATSIKTFKQELEAQKETVVVVAPSKNRIYDPRPEENIWRLPSVQFYGEKRYRFVYPWNFHLKDLEKIDLDIIHTQTPFPVGAAGFQLGRRKKLPLVHTYHTRYQEYAHYLHLPGKILQAVTQTSMSFVIRFVNGHDAIVAPSEGVKRELENFGVRKPITVIPTGIVIDDAIKMAQAQDPNATLEKIGLRPNEPFFIFTSRIGKEKNIGFILEAAAEILKAAPDHKLLIVGDGDEKQNLMKRAVKLGIQKRTIFTGFMSHEDLFPLYRAAKAFLFASHTETQGLAVVEAMAIGTPVVALKATGIEDVLTGDHGGFLIDGSQKEFIKKTLLLLNDTDLQSEKSAEAQLRAKNFQASVCAKKLINLYERVIEEKKESVRTI